MSSETLRKSIDFLLDRAISGAEHKIQLTFFGGEPFLCLDRMEEAVEYGRERRPNVYKKIQFTATTNGTVVGPRVEKLIRDTRMSLLVSMDGGHGASSYRPFVSGRSSHSHLVKNLPKLVAWSPEVMVRMTYHPGSLSLLENVRQALELGAPSVALCPVVEADWTGHEEALEAAYMALANAYIDEARKGRIMPLYLTNTRLRDHHMTLHGAARPTRPCSVGSGMLGINVDGSVMPCHRFLERRSEWLGTVDSTQLSDERWRFVHLSSADILGCDGCEARLVCGGGCRALTFGADGLYQTHSGHCLNMRAHVRAVRHIYETLLKEENEPFRRFVGASASHNPALAELATR